MSSNLSRTASQTTMPPPTKLERQESRTPLPPFTASFTDQTKQMKIARKIYFKVLVGGSFAIIIAMFCFFSIYWGALWKTPVRSLDGWVIDFDGSTIGSTVSQALTASSASTKIAWSSRPASDYPGGPTEVAGRVHEEDTWIAVVIHSGATDALNSAIQNINASYDGRSAVTIYATEARSENAFRSILSPTSQSVLLQASREFAMQTASSLASSSSLTNILTNAPQLITNPLSFTFSNIAPFDIPVATAMTFVGLIYLLILSFFIVMIGLSAREISGLDRHLTTASLIRLRLTSTFTAYFFISLFYSLVSRAFQVDFSRKFGAGGFVVFWMLNWCGMLSVGLALEAMMTVLTVRGIPFFMIFFIIINVSVCVYPIQALPGFFRYGYAMPFYNVSRAVRTILFATKNEVGLNFGVLIAYIMVSVCVTIPLATWWRRRQAKKEDADTFKEDKDVEEAEGQ